MGIYGSEYTGAEHDLAIGRILGNKYGQNEDPGCHLVGTTNENPQNLFELQRPGKYTIHFYYDMGPNGVPINIPFEGNSPIFMTVTVGRDIFKSDTVDDVECLYQQVMVGGSLFWRDLLHNDYAWREVILENRDIEIIDNLTSNRTDAALSANMGRELKYIIDTQQIGNMNLINNSALRRGIQYWIYDSSHVSRATDRTFDSKPTFKVNVSSGLSNDQTMFTSNAEPITINGIGLLTASIYVYSTANIELSLSINVMVGNLLSPTDSVKKSFKLSGSNVWKRISVTTKDLSSLTATTKAYIAVSVTPPVSNVYFALPKLEYGQYATGWMPSYYDMWCEYDNANFINEVLVDTDNLQEQDGLVYRAESDSFVNYPVATGGGGGFISLEPDRDPASGEWIPPVYVRSHKELLYHMDFETRDATYRQLKFYNRLSSRWENLLSPPFYLSSTPPEDRDIGWLDLRTDNGSSFSATLNYYDGSNWRPITAKAAGVWYFGASAPSDTSLMWIKTPDFIPHLYYEGTWEPLHAVWGRNISGS